MTIDISLPWPPACLTPNAKRRLHWSKYRGPSKKYRADCCILTKAKVSSGRLVAVHFRPPDRRKRDDDGMIGQFKAGRDGIADALKTDDHEFRPAYTFGEPVKGGEIVVTIETGEKSGD